mmetsp:Transcript_32511/g.73682  ORF Transcript_32511/g.73682 Transcript_32511/m.73682 type:complete len:228 (-) Transcript_32511:199-882(-)
MRTVLTATCAGAVNAYITASAMSLVSSNWFLEKPSPTGLPISTPIFSAADLSLFFIMSSVPFTSPGHIVVSVTPVPTSSRRVISVSVSTKVLLAQYTASVWKCRMPASELMVMIFPLPRATMLFITAPMPCNTPLQFTSTVCSHWSTSAFFISVKYITPAQLISTSTSPSLSSASFTKLSTLERDVTSQAAYTQDPGLSACLARIVDWTSCNLSRRRAPMQTLAPSL